MTDSAPTQRDLRKQPPAHGNSARHPAPPPDRHLDHKFLKLKEIAERLSASPSTTRRWLTKKGVRAYRFGSAKNATLRYREDHVEQALAEAYDGPAADAHSGSPDDFNLDRYLEMEVKDE